ncbi:MAG: hypothetical protein ABWY11_07415 [Umezawaea sp.]
MLYAATQDVTGNSCIGPDGVGGFRGDSSVRRQGKAGLDRAAATRLWDTTADLVETVA